MLFDSTSADEVVLAAPGFPAATHPAEPDLFCRQAAMPGHIQERIARAHVVVIGCGGLGSWIALSLARLGVRGLTLLDPDRFDRTNAPRQLMFRDDLGEFKALAVARNIAAHMTTAGRVQAVACHFEDVESDVEGLPDLVIAGVDNNAARLAASRWARKHHIPTVFAMLSRDGLRARVFLQRVDGPCLLCVLPDTDGELAAPCAAASIASCLLATSHAIQMAVSVLGDGSVPVWRETSLDGTTERVGQPSRRPGCPNCL
jgi:molybdopterin-synthase adenylyltransferase